MQNLEQLNISEGIFPINSKLPNINMTMKVRFDSKDEEISFMEKLSYALNLTGTIAYYFLNNIISSWRNRLEAIRK